MFFYYTHSREYELTNQGADEMRLDISVLQFNCVWCGRCL